MATTIESRGDPPNVKSPCIMGGFQYNLMIINGSPHYYNCSNGRESQFIINGWKYDKLIFLMNEIEQKKKKKFYKNKIRKIYIFQGGNL